MTTGTENVSTVTSVQEPHARPAGGAGAGVWSQVRRHPWPLVCLALVVFSYFLIRWARTSPGFDPYGWLVWGYQTLRLNLNLGGAPSWKPVTFIFTVPYSIFGHLSYWLWMVTAVSLALGGPIVAGRIVYRLVLQSTEQVWPAIVGAVFAGLCVLGIVQYTHYWLSAQSDPMLVTFFLLAIDMHMLRRHRWAFTFLALVSLGRPEGWPFLGLYFLWAWRAVPRMRLLMVIEVILIPALWFGVPVLSGSPWNVAGNLAQDSPRMLHSNKIVGTFNRFRELSYWQVEVLAVLGTLMAAVRRDWRVLALAACSVAWLIIEIGFALHGFPGVPRYMFEGAALFIVVAGVGLGWLLSGAVRLLADARRRALPRSDWRGSVGRLAGAGLAIAMVVLMVPRAVSAERVEHADLIHERARTAEIHRLDAALRAFGGYRFIRSCGDPAADVEWVSILAWYSKLDVGYVGHRPQYIINVEKNKPSVLFTALSNGWIVHTYHLRPSAPAACRNLNKAYYIVTSRHPGGFVGHQA